MSGWIFYFMFDKFGFLPLDVFLVKAVTRLVACIIFIFQIYFGSILQLSFYCYLCFLLSYAFL